MGPFLVCGQSRPVRRVPVLLLPPVSAQQRKLGVVAHQERRSRPCAGPVGSDWLRHICRPPEIFVFFS